MHTLTSPSAPAGCAPGPESLARWRHALRNPLHAILTATAVLESCPADSQAAVEARRVIARQTRNLAWLIGDSPHDEPRAA